MKDLYDVGFRSQYGRRCKSYPYNKTYIPVLYCVTTVVGACVQFILCIFSMSERGYMFLFGNKCSMGGSPGELSEELVT